MLSFTNACATAFGQVAIASTKSVAFGTANDQVYVAAAVNTDGGELRVLGLFRDAGIPSEADGGAPTCLCGT